MSALEHTVPTRRDVERKLALLLVPMVGIAALLLAQLYGEPVLIPGRHLAPWAIFPAMVVCELPEIRLRLGGKVTYHSLVLIPITIGMFLVQPFWLVVAHLAAVAVTQIAHRARPALIAGNVCLDAIAMSAGLLVFRAIAQLDDPISLTGWLAAVTPRP